MRFRAKETFHCPENGSTYVEGMMYTVRPGNDKLAALVNHWLNAGKVEVVQGVTATVSGTDKGLVARVLEKLWP